VTATGDTLCAKGAGIVIPPIKFPEPSISFAIEPKTRADEDKISQASHRITDEDPTVRFERDPDTNQLLISGNGELHVRIITDKLKKRFNVDVDLKPPKISYKETIRGRADVQGRHKKQTGGRGQFGDVWIKMEPLPRGKDFEFEDKIFGGPSPEISSLGREGHAGVPEEGRPRRLPRSSISRSSFTMGRITRSIRRTSPSRSPPPRPSRRP